MPKTIPTLGDYAYFKLSDDSTKIGRVVAAYKKDGEDWVRLRYWYDAFTGYAYEERPIDEVEYTIQPRGVSIEFIDEDQSSTDESDDPFKYMHEMAYKSALILGIQSAAKKVLEATAVPTAPYLFLTQRQYNLDPEGWKARLRDAGAPEDQISWCHPLFRESMRSL